MRVSQFRQKRKDLVIKFAEGETLSIVYDPYFLTPDREEELRVAATSDEMAKFLAGMLVEWDLTEEDGSTFGTEHAQLRTLPVAVLGRITREIADDVVESARAEGKDLPATSQPAAT